MRHADAILEFPMIDQDPLPGWSFVPGHAPRRRRASDAAPRRQWRAAQAILDCRALSECLAGSSDPVAALKAYEDRRLQPTANVVLTNRTNPPDAILREVYLRTGDKPFRNIDDVISHDELAALSERYQRVAGFHKESLQPAEKT